MFRKRDATQFFLNERDELEPVVSDDPLRLCDERQRKYRVAWSGDHWQLYGLSDDGRWVSLRRLKRSDFLWVLRSVAGAGPEQSGSSDPART